MAGLIKKKKNKKEFMDTDNGVCWEEGGVELGKTIRGINGDGNS